MYHLFKFKTYFLCHGDVHEKETQMHILLTEFTPNMINELKQRVFDSGIGAFYIEHKHMGVVRHVPEC